MLRNIHLYSKTDMLSEKSATSGQNQAVFKKGIYEFPYPYFEELLGAHMLPLRGYKI